jgi:hypothetical protein
MAKAFQANKSFRNPGAVVLTSHRTPKEMKSVQAGRYATSFYFPSYFTMLPLTNLHRIERQDNG